MTTFNSGANNTSHCLQIVKSEPVDGISYRYEGYEWHTVVGDSYELETNEGQCYTGYTVNFDVDAAEPHYKYNSVTRTWEFQGYRAVPIRRSIRTINGYKVVLPPYIDDNDVVTSSNIPYSGIIRMLGEAPDGRQIETRVPRHRDYNLYIPGTISNLEYIPSIHDPNCPPVSCTFRVFDKGQTVIELERPVCPEVSDEPICQLSTPELLQLLTEPFGEIRVTTTELTEAGEEGAPLPEHCQNIYNLSPNPPYNPEIDGESFTPTGFTAVLVRQVCSAEDCEPPLIIRKGSSCTQEECPEDTCDVLCGDTICCYDSDGISVFSFPAS